MRVLSHVKEAHGLNDLQFEAVSAALTNALSVVTGGPGTGKTRTITAIIDAYKKLCLDIGQMPRILLIAPTGKAADRAHESTGHEASTIHMALGQDRKSVVKGKSVAVRGDLGGRRIKKKKKKK